MKTLRTFSALVICFALLITSYQSASAILGSWALRISWLNFSGTSDAWSGRMVRKLSSSLWAADIVSYTSSPAISITLGWTYFSASERCGQTPKQTIQGGARSVVASQTANTIFVNTMSCNQTRFGSSNGRSEFKHGGATVYDTWHHEEVIP
ncbi:MAG TPA: hypothetical protein VNJ29_04050 [Candidatus Nitrosotenuis sp.]|nr:hypothetical protein [Candidatus Nitrosotenuis sp.]